MIRTTFRHTMLAVTLAAASGLAAAQAASPVGLWKTVDDETKAEKSLVRISDGGGALVGKIEKLFNPSEPDPKCTDCTDDRKGKPILGMTIIKGAKASGDGTWEGGEILDPQKGKTYKLRLKPADNGKTMEVRGYLGPFFRNQTWHRVD